MVKNFFIALSNGQKLSAIGFCLFLFWSALLGRYEVIQMNGQSFIKLNRLTGSVERCLPRGCEKYQDYSVNPFDQFDEKPGAAATVP